MSGEGFVTRWQVACLWSLSQWRWAGDHGRGELRHLAAILLHEHRKVSLPVAQQPAEGGALGHSSRQNGLLSLG